MNEGSLNNDAAGPVTLTKEEVISLSVSASVLQWTKRIKKARERWEPDFQRMRENMEFAAGFQWAAQEKLDEERYTNNLVLRLVKQKVASLYARNPKVVAERRRRLDFKMWDGRSETLQQAAAVLASSEVDPVTAIQAQAIIADYTAGRQLRDLVDRVARTLECVYAWQLDNQSTSFKVQMKQMVGRVVITGVGYVRQNFIREDQDTNLATADTESTNRERLRLVKVLMDRINAEELTMDSPELVTLQSLLASLGQGSSGEVTERLTFDFPPSTSVIIDPNCRAIRGFIGAKWIAQEYLLPVDVVNAFADTQLKGDSFKRYHPSGQETRLEGLAPDPEEELRACVWEVFDLTTQSRFFLIDGYDNYLLAPEPVEPKTKGFWPIFGLTFNHVEVEPGQQKATIFPPSDVQIAKSPQKEWNRTREALRNQRKANAPKYLTGKGWLSEDTKDRLQAALPNEVIEVEGPSSMDIGKLVVAFQPAPLDGALYDTAPLIQDIALAAGNDDATRPASASETATAATINEQSRLTVTSSNVDDLDDLLTDVAEAGGEMLLRELSLETVQRIAGRGAVWPEMERGEFINSLYLTVMAGSSGRPNKSLELSNFQQVAPLLLQAGVKPFFIVREALKRLDDRLDAEEAFSIGGPSGPAAVGPLPSATGEPMQGKAIPNAEDKNPAGTMPQSMRQPVLPQTQTM